MSDTTHVTVTAEYTFAWWCYPLRPLCFVPGLGRLVRALIIARGITIDYRPVGEQRV